MMTATRLILGLFIVLSAGVATAGDIRPVAYTPPSGTDDTFCFYSSGGASKASKPAKGSGTVHPKAVVVTLRGSSGRKICVAVDSSKPDAKEPDTLRFDLTGKGRFTGVPTVALIRTMSSRGPMNYYQARFGPKTIQAALSGRTIPITVRGLYYQRTSDIIDTVDPYRQMEIVIGMAVEGKGRFGKRVLPVRIIDSNANLKAGDSWRSVGRSARTGDTLAIDTGDGSFTKGVRKGWYGSPIEIDGAWYSVSLDDAGKKLTVAQVDLKLGKIHIKQPKWSCTLVGKKHLLRLTGGPEPVAAPVDSYRVMNYQQWGPPDAKGRRPRLGCRDLGTRDADKALVAVKAGKTTIVEVGSPLTASIIATPQSNGVVSLALSLLDSSGRTVNDLSLPNGNRPTAPKATVRDATGKTVYSTSLEYG
jgi:hypothetical protein